MSEGRSLSFVIVTIICLTLTSHSSAGTKQTITGEIVETFCWAVVNVGGAPHAACGIECAKRGIPVAIVDAKSRKAFILLPARDKAAIPQKLIESMGRRVIVSGETFSRGGLQFLTVQSWEPAR